MSFSVYPKLYPFLVYVNSGQGHILPASLIFPLMLGGCTGASVRCEVNYPAKENIMSGSVNPAVAASNTVNMTGSIVSTSSSTATAAAVYDFVRHTFFGGTTPSNTTTSTIDAAQILLDTTGSTVTYPASGQITLTLTNADTGLFLGSSTFPWIKSGNTLIFSNPTSVNQWLASVAGSVPNPGVSYSFVNLVVTAPSGATSETVVNTIVYQGEKEASATATQPLEPTGCSGTNPKCRYN